MLVEGRVFSLGRTSKIKVRINEEFFFSDSVSPLEAIQLSFLKNISRHLILMVETRKLHIMIASYAIISKTSRCRIFEFQVVKVTCSITKRLKTRGKTYSKIAHKLGSSIKINYCSRVKIPVLFKINQFSPWQSSISHPKISLLLSAKTHFSVTISHTVFAD